MELSQGLGIPIFVHFPPKYLVILVLRIIDKTRSHFRAKEAGVMQSYHMLPVTQFINSRADLEPAVCVTPRVPVFNPFPPT